MPSLPDRPAALTPEVQNRIVEAMAMGSYYAPACRAAGVTPQAVDYWRKLYESGVEHAQSYADFFGALARASAVAEVSALGEVKSGRMGWQGPAWFLERRFPKRWGRKQELKADILVGGEGAVFERIVNPRDEEVQPPAETA